MYMIGNILYLLNILVIEVQLRAYKTANDFDMSSIIFHLRVNKISLSNLQ